MRKRFPTILILILALSLIKFNSVSDAFVNVEKFRGAEIKSDMFNPMIAKNINSSKLTLTLNDTVYSNNTDGIYMSSTLNIMIPYRLLIESLHCAAHFYDDNTLLILQGENQIAMVEDSYQMDVNGSTVDLEEPMTIKNGQTYVPLKELSDYLNFDYEWDAETNNAYASTERGANTLPASFDLRMFNRASAVRDQGDYGTCWAFAALGALQSSLLPVEDYCFSVDHMNNMNSAVNGQEGGEYTMGVAYLTSWQGPVFEADDPYGDGRSTPGLSAVKHVQEIQFLDKDNQNEIKEAVFKYGGVQSSIYLKTSNPIYYNKSNCAYYYNGHNDVNHDIVIIGWDDNYPASNFSKKPEGDGAFICQNSWGSSFGKSGYFYVSYYDENIGTQSVCYTDVEPVDNYDSIYQSDMNGYGGKLGYNKSSIYAANVFTTEYDEVIEAVGFYTLGKNTSYEIYVVPQFMGYESLSSGWKAAEGKKNNAGFYTVKLDTRIQINEGTKFAIVIKLDTPGAKRPLAVEYARDGNVEVNIDDGESYISESGRVWESVEKTQKCNICLKAYTSHEEEE